MNMIEADRVRDLNWAEFVGSLPLDGVTRPSGAVKVRAAARVRKAVAKRKAPQSA